ncbi:MAG: hypothetical protein ABH871_07680 [Pseudomonadota bacterium]
MRILTCTFALAFWLSLTASAWALMLSLSPKELKEQSSHIIRGEITDVVCTGEFEENPCVSLAGYRSLSRRGSVILSDM